MYKIIIIIIKNTVVRNVEICVCVHMPSKFLSMENQIIFIIIFQATIVICNHGKKKKLGISMALTLGSNWYQVCQIYDFTHIKEFIYFLTKFLVSFTFFSEEGSLMRYNTLIFSCMCMCDAPRPGRHKTVTTPEIIDQIHELFLEDRRISTKSIAEQLGISCERVRSLIREDSYSCNLPPFVQRMSVVKFCN